jgi:hypothetical protein
VRPVERPCPCGCSDRGTRAPTRLDHLEAWQGTDDGEERPSPYDGAALSPPWSEGWFVDVAVHAGTPVFTGRWGAQYGATSPRTGEPCSWGRALAEWEESTAGGGLWDYDEEARSAARNGDMTLLRQRLGLVRSRPRVAPPKRMQVAARRA